MWHSGWDERFSEKVWGKYPDTQIVRFVARNYYKCAPRKKIRILEVGCGPGANLVFLAKEGFDTSGIDGSTVAIEKAKERLDAENVHAALHIGDIMEMPYPDDYFDCVIDCECIYANDSKDSRVIMKEIHRVLKSGGKLFSMTFATGTYGDGNGIKVEGEENAYTKIHEGPLQNDSCITRFSTEEDVKTLYGLCLDLESIEYIILSVESMQHKIKEWLVTAKKD